MDIQTLLSGLLSGALTVPAVSWLLNLLEARGKIFDKTSKRAIAFILSFLLGALGLLGMIYLEYLPEPVDLETWLNAVIIIGTMAYTTSQMVLSGYKSSKSYLQSLSD